MGCEAGLVVPQRRNIRSEFVGPCSQQVERASGWPGPPVWRLVKECDAGQLTTQRENTG